ncbi:hypothetical protein [Saccharothrix obliqua]|uniref:hypothetical protein n=1 Tax=Saccharothrix obliqua TaxID=2861747 RepID=UPI001C5D2713|nr:hypothetical protein [Saccharothrix obliqua]MBW4718497.1 hypothetical protein [Saccharothrix obliqua]
MAEDVERELRELGRELRREPSEEVVAAVVDRLPERPPRRWAGPFLLAACLLVLALVSLALLRREAPGGTVEAAATSSAPTTWSVPEESTPFCGRMPRLSDAGVVERWLAWRPPVDAPWASPERVLFQPFGQGRGVVAVTYSTPKAVWTLERYSEDSQVAVESSARPDVVELEPDINGRRGQWAQGPLVLSVQLVAVTKPEQTSTHQCTGRRLTWTTSTGVVYAITSNTLTEADTLALARSLG